MRFTLTRLREQIQGIERMMLEPADSDRLHQLTISRAQRFAAIQEGEGLLAKLETARAELEQEREARQ